MFAPLKTLMIYPYLVIDFEHRVWNKASPKLSCQWPAQLVTERVLTLVDIAAWRRDRAWGWTEQEGGKWRERKKRIRKSV